MIIDTSAIIAIIFRESGYRELIDKMMEAQFLGVGTVTLAETGIVLCARLESKGKILLARFLQEAGIVQIPFGEDHWREAVSAYERFGRGRHPAKLNFGDCISYATAKLAEQPLLFVGKDFSKTDLEKA